VAEANKGMPYVPQGPSLADAHKCPPYVPQPAEVHKLRTSV
jgi:hypothetical protein